MMQGAYLNWDTSVVTALLNDCFFGQFNTTIIAAIRRFTGSSTRSAKVEDKKDVGEIWMCLDFLYILIPKMHSFDILVHLLREKTWINHAQFLTLENKIGPL